ncbi:protein of unknown function [Bradyrhizobium sp. ORS 285]|uniref:hypothetical protein n=1 Tax=Bradyrhizobium sp. ORS 285 TaxID=115808 RepID=UPI0002409586|nr:hypothetical protein [Bradyrhizobium sp. ORS 285]CCD89834.1 hypothetical protein BRAO285_850036 [Bradyrhizobium sp. ORS 285]SMX61536.1 protein of unknown function [Bradyrhizobium sp. ORS 285]
MMMPLNNAPIDSYDSRGEDHRDIDALNSLHISYTLLTLALLVAAVIAVFLPPQ